MKTVGALLVLVLLLSILPLQVHATPTTVVFLTSGTTWTVPVDWTSANNTIEVIGAGGGGGIGTTVTSGRGGGGGAYSRISNLSLTPGASVTYQVGAGGGPGGGTPSAGTDTFFNRTSGSANTCADTTSVCAKGGTGGATGVGGAGGAAGSGTGTVKYSGGAGTDDIRSGGGGAGGPSGDGAASGSQTGGSTGAGGGGGDSGGSTGGNSTTATGGTGGNNVSGSGGGGGGTSGNPGTNGSSGGGGGGRTTSGTAGKGGDGGAGTEWDATHGSGGGAGGGGANSAGSSSVGGAGGNGGTYGGGAGGGGLGGTTGGTGGTGANGLIIIIYGGLTLNGNVQFGVNLTVSRRLTKAVTNFLIDHPLDPANKLLSYSAIESPDVKNIYDGLAVLDENGEADIGLPKYFMALNRTFRYQFFALEEAMPDLYLKTEVKDNHFTVAGGKPGGRISWQITGNRQDAYVRTHEIYIEVDKGNGQPVKKGECLFAPLCK